MLTSVIVSLLAVILLVFLLFYKKEMIFKMFTLNMSAPANEFIQQLEQTADSIIKRLEEEAAQLELLLDEAESKIGMLSQQVEHANKIIAQLTNIENKSPMKDEFQLRYGADVLDGKEMLTNYSIKDQVPVNLPEMTETRPQAIPNPTENIDNGAYDGKESLSFEKHRLIIAMAEQGYNETEIAKAAGVGKGEVMLVLQLNKK